MIKQETIKTITQNDDGSENVVTEIKETTFDKGKEPDYIKIYTKMWCDFRGIPDSYIRLFTEMATRMTYCNSSDLKHSQLVNTGDIFGDELMEACGWKSKVSLKKGLQALCKCKAIKRVSRGIYQINPEYAGRGAWRYNPREDNGGVKDLVATFNFKENSVDTLITWHDDEETYLAKKIFGTID